VAVVAVASIEMILAVGVGDELGLPAEGLQSTI